MQAVILAAGEGKRMRPLTLERPKPLISVSGRPILEHLIEALPKEVDEIILVVGYRADMIRQHFGDLYKGRRVKYVHQLMPAGTAHALKVARPLLREGRFILLCGDDIHGAEAFEKALSHPLAILVATHNNPSLFGVISRNSSGMLADIIEKPEVPATNLISTGAMVLDTRIFRYEAALHDNGEYYITDMVRQFAEEYPIQIIEQDFWIPIGYPEDIEVAERRLMQCGLGVQSEVPRV